MSDSNEPIAISAPAVSSDERLYAALSVLGGRDFRYPILGRKVEEFSQLP